METGFESRAHVPNQSSPLGRVPSTAEGHRKKRLLIVLLFISSRLRMGSNSEPWETEHMARFPARGQLPWASSWVSCSPGTSLLSATLPLPKSQYGTWDGTVGESPDLSLGIGATVY